MNYLIHIKKNLVSDLIKYIFFEHLYKDAHKGCS